MKNILLIFCTILMVSCGSNSEKKKTKADFLNAVEGTWTVSEIHNITKEELTKTQKTPFIKFEEEKVSGNNGCNNYFSSINTIDEKTIKFSMFGETKMMCAEMKISDAFGSLLSKIDTYSVDKNTLTFFNSEGHKILVFTK
ncbi:META domain-containing protein [Polaribacter haliotis]|uniref:META domain-containing protein n=1 Tax=Polaribacter haliotis TaxID=1888915 RepID=A0A7L8ACP1_9FLAO|nr:META domain-containing protein [Polaribacter haliotis]QOD59775.1 META domain-containing protein [Polaribacter haliotis]